ncbi:MAG TPA: hypothetical protein VIA62_27565 [Thermoanaerobaculia bacterium]|jgi:hypothetical protein|nr:hypothetical protein [Thermoanaerobaculia bacterium]
MTAINSLLARFLTPAETLNHLDELGNDLFIRRHRGVDDAAEIAQLLSGWARIELPFAIIWLSLEERVLVILTPAELFLHRLAPPTDLP